MQYTAPQSGLSDLRKAKANSVRPDNVRGTKRCPEGKGRSWERRQVGISNGPMLDANSKIELQGVQVPSWKVLSSEAGTADCEEAI